MPKQTLVDRVQKLRALVDICKQAANHGGNRSLYLCLQEAQSRLDEIDRHLDDLSADAREPDIGDTSRRPEFRSRFAHFIDDILAKTDIVKLIAKRVQLNKAGSVYRARCPFHGGKSQDFTIDPVKQFYHCFGCGAHGTALGFLMEHDKLSFHEAVEELAIRLGLETPVTHQQ